MRTLAVLLLLSLGLLAADSKDQTFTGTVSDTMCGAHHTMMPGLSDDQCTRACVKTGADYAREDPIARRRPAVDRCRRTRDTRDQFD